MRETATRFRSRTARLSTARPPLATAPRDLGWMLVLALTVVALAPLTYPGFFETHSGFLPTFNVSHMAQAPNWGRPADVLRSEGKLPYLLAWPFLLITGDGRVAIRWGYALAFLLGALGVYAWTRRWLGDRGGILAATVYTYLPWHLSAVYVRGAYAEAWLWATWPWLLWAIDRLATGQTSAARAARLAPIAVAAAGLLALAAAFWSQPGLCALFLPVLAAYAIVVHARLSRPVVAALAVLLVGYGVLGVVGRTASTQVEQSGPRYLYPFQLFAPGWGYELPERWSGSSSGAVTMSFQLGLAAVALGLVAVALYVRDWPQIGTTLRRAWLFWCASLAVVVVLTLPVSAALWQYTGLNALLTSPWQLLVLAGCPLAFLAGSAVRVENPLIAQAAQDSGTEPTSGTETAPDGLTERPAGLWGVLLAFVVLASYFYLQPRFTGVNPGAQPVAMFKSTEAEAPQLMILQADISPPAQIAETLALTLTWQATVPVAEDYTVFVHLLDSAGAKVAQQDLRPCVGSCPTDTWQPGEIIVDRHSLVLPADAVPGPYRLALGLYQVQTGKRATVVGRDDGTVMLHVP